MVGYSGFNAAVALELVKEAEEKAAEGGPDGPMWTQQAAESRARASGFLRTKREYEWRANLKERYKIK